MPHAIADHGGSLSPLQRVVGVNEKYSTVRKQIGIGLEGIGFRFKCGHEGMSHRTGDGDPPGLAGQHIAGARKAGNVGRPRHRHSRMAALGAAQGEVDDGPAGSGMHAAGSLGGHQAGNTYGIDQIRLDDLGLDQGRRHLHHGLIRKEDLPLGHGRDIPGEAQRGQVGQEIAFKKAGLRQPVDLLVAEMKPGQRIHDRLKPGSHKIAPSGMGPHEQGEGGRLIHMPVEVSGRHGQFIKIGKQGSGKLKITHWMVAPYNLSIRLRAWL